MIRAVEKARQFVAPAVRYFLFLSWSLLIYLAGFATCYATALVIVRASI